MTAGVVARRKRHSGGIVLMVGALLLSLTACTNRSYLTQYYPNSGSASGSGIPAGWTSVGSTITASGASNPLLTEGPGQTLYLAYSESTGATSPTTTTYVKEYNGTSWVDLPGTVPQLGAPMQLLVDTSGNIYLLFNGSSSSVQEYNGTTWSALGTFPAVGSGASLALGPSGVLYAVFADPSNGSAATCVKWQGGSWVTVGAAGFTGLLNAPPSLAIDSSGTLYVAYEDYANASRANVMEYTGTAWAQYGSADFTTGTAMDIGLSLDSSTGTVYVGYLDPTANRVPRVVASSGGSWTEVGGGPVANAYSDGLSFPDTSSSTLFAGVLGSGKLSILTYSGSQWTAFGGGFLTYTAPSIVIGGQGTVYIAYLDNNQSGITVVSQ